MKAIKTNQDKIAALFATRKQELEGELSRLSITEELVQDALAEKLRPVPEKFAQLDMDTVYNKALSDVGTAYGTDAQMALDYILRNI